MNKLYDLMNYRFVTFGEAKAGDIPYDEAPPERECPYCGKKIVFRGVVRDGRVRKFFPQRCDCEEAKVAADIEEKRDLIDALRSRKEEQRREVALAHNDGVGRRYKEKTFENYETPNPEMMAAKRTAMSFAKDFVDGAFVDDKYFLLLFGGCGCGKTHLACAIANELRRNYYVCRFTTFGDLLATVRDTYNSSSSEQVAIDGYRKAPLLIVDDLGKEKATEFSTATLFGIVNYRYDNGLPTIVTTNHKPSELVKRLTPSGGDSIEAEAIVSRLYEVARRVDMSGVKDRRIANG